MSEVSKKNPKENQIQAKSRIDSKAELIEPIDFSFKDLMHLEGFQCDKIFYFLFSVLNEIKLNFFKKLRTQVQDTLQNMNRKKSMENTQVWVLS